MNTQVTIAANNNLQEKTVDNTSTKNDDDICSIYDDDIMSAKSNDNKDQVLPPSIVDVKPSESSKRPKRKVQLKLPFPTTSKGVPSQAKDQEKLPKRLGNDISIMAIKKKFKHHRMNVADPLLLHGYAFFGEGSKSNQLYVFMRTRNNFDVHNIDEDKNN